MCGESYCSDSEIHACKLFCRFHHLVWRWIETQQCLELGRKWHEVFAKNVCMKFIYRSEALTENASESRDMRRNNRCDFRETCFFFSQGRNLRPRIDIIRPNSLGARTDMAFMECMCLWSKLTIRRTCLCLYGSNFVKLGVEIRPSFWHGEILAATIQRHTIWWKRRKKGLHACISESLQYVSPHMPTLVTRWCLAT